MEENSQKLGDYLILEKIAHGGMAQIYKAKTTDPQGIERLVVIKRILPHIASNQEYVDMLIDEAKIAVQFNHGNIAGVYDLGKAGDDYFIVMEYVDGKTLAEILKDFRDRSEKIPIEFIVYCMIQICQGLEYMHRKTDAHGRELGVIHRDISPQNVIVSYSSTVKIIDFGVAKALDKMSHTESGILKGKFAYMSPEQAHGKELDRRSDIFSVGVLLWEMLTQQRLFKRKTNQQTIKAVKKAEVPSVSKYRFEVPQELDKIIKKALQKNRRRRFQSASEMALALNLFLVKQAPDFQPFSISKLLYEYFGPERDEEGLSPEVPELMGVKKKQKSDPLIKDSIEEEKTQIDYVANFYHRFVKKPIFWLFILFCILTATLWTFRSLFILSESTILLQVSPEDVGVMIDGKPIKIGHRENAIKMKAVTPFSLLIFKDGYVSYEASYILEKDEVKKLSIELQKVVPPYGSLFVVTQPAGATVYLNDIEWGQKTPTHIPQLNNGTDYRIGLYLEEHRFIEKKMTIQGGQTNQLNVSLDMDYASLEINSSPEKARVIIDDQIVGTTPYTLKNIKPYENIEFKIELDGFNQMEMGVKLNPGENKKITLSLNKT